MTQPQRSISGSALSKCTDVLANATTAALLSGCSEGLSMVTGARTDVFMAATRGGLAGAACSIFLPPDPALSQELFDTPFSANKISVIFCVPSMIVFGAFLQSGLCHFPLADVAQQSARCLLAGGPLIVGFVYVSNMTRNAPSQAEHGVQVGRPLGASAGRGEAAPPPYERGGYRGVPF